MIGVVRVIQGVIKLIISTFSRVSHTFRVARIEGVIWALGVDWVIDVVIDR